MNPNDRDSLIISRALVDIAITDCNCNDTSQAIKNL